MPREACDLPRASNSGPGDQLQHRDGAAGHDRHAGRGAWPSFSYFSTWTLLAGAASILGTGVLCVSVVSLHVRSNPGGTAADAHGFVNLPSESRSLAAVSDNVSLPPDFDWRAYLKWNPELQADGIRTREAAEQHYLQTGHSQRLVYKHFTLGIRYTACGGLMNQHYCHIAALTLAHLANAEKVIWPPMQERQSFSKRYHTAPNLNEQSWLYLDAETLWDLPTIQRQVQAQYGIEIIKHPPDVAIPDMTHLERAFQTYDLSASEYESQLRFKKPIYIGKHNPFMLARAVMDAGRQVLLKHGHQPTSVLVDLPCTLFLMDNRNLTVVEDIARLLTFSPTVEALASKVIDGIARESGVVGYNGVHLRMEKDAVDWAIILGGRDRYWRMYKDTMIEAGLDSHTPLYVASGLLKAAKDDIWAQEEMARLSREILAEQFASSVVFKEKYLTEEELATMSNEQSGLIDLLVLRKSTKLVGIGVSTFSFYLYELRLMDGKAPVDTQLLMASYIGTDELFFSAGLAAVHTRQRWDEMGELPDLCRRPSGRPCFSFPT